MEMNRRKLLLSTIFGAGAVGLRALATGLPVSMFSRTARADSDPAAPDTAVCTKPQYVFLLTSGSGDPLNANVPGTFDDPGIYHSTDPQMAPMGMMVGGKSVKAATPWASLPANIMARTAFFHHSTYTNSHGDAAKVNRLQGAVQRQEMLVSLFAKNLQKCLNTVQANPVVLSTNLITFNGAVQPILSPPNLQQVLLAPTGALANLQKIRDTHLDQMNALLKQTGTQAQKQMLDRYALSQQQARTLSQDLLSDLATVKGSTRQDLNTAAAVLFKMNVSPVMVAGYSFGGDNHGDTALAGETRETVASVAAIADLYTKLAKYNLQDQVTMAFQNVFGRTLSTKAHQNNADGRNHNANHHCTVLIGSNLKSSLIGGVKLQSNGFDYQATGLNSTTGAADDNGDVSFDDTFASVGKTFGHAVGVDATVLETQITKGKVITAALA
jgi:hypothetical protein